MDDKQLEQLKAWKELRADIVKAGAVLSPMEIVDIVTLVFQAQGVELNTKIKAVVKQDLDDPLMEEQHNPAPLAVAACEEGNENG